jgi:hypothetical protein
MDENRTTFETEGEAVAFCEGLKAGLVLVESPCEVNIDMFVEDDRWTVIHSLSY